MTDKTQPIDEIGAALDELNGLAHLLNWLSCCEESKEVRQMVPDDHRSPALFFLFQTVERLQSQMQTNLSDIAVESNERHRPAA